MRLRLILGAIDDQRGGPALILTQGLPNVVPSVQLTRPNGQVAALTATPATISGFTGSAFRNELTSRGVSVFSVRIPGGLSGSVGLTASVGGWTVPARFRPFPVGARSSISFSLSSCRYGHFNVGAFGRSLWSAAISGQYQGHQIDFKLMAGDNLYLDVAPDQNSFGAGDQVQEVAKRYVDYWLNDDDLAIAFASSPTLLTFDDHDLWNDFPHSITWLTRSWPANQAASTRAAWDGIDTFQRPLNPPSIGAAGRSYRFVAGDPVFRRRHAVEPFGLVVGQPPLHASERPRGAPGLLERGHRPARSLRGTAALASRPELR